MTGFRVSTALWMLACACGLALGALAQPQGPGPASAPPRGLSPQSPPPEEPEPSVVPVPGQVELRGAEPAHASPPDQEGTPPDGRIVATELAAIDPAGAGLLGSDTGGFAPALWAGSQRNAVAARLSRLPVPPNSPAMQILLRRLLLTAAPPPEGAAPPDEPSLLALRLSQLVANGWTAEAEALAAQSARDDSFARQAWAEALLLDGRDAEACGDATALRQSANDDYWLKLRAFCHAMQNDLQAAALTLDVMRERGVSDEAFFDLASALVDGGSARTSSMPAPSGLHIALLRRAGKPLPATLVGWLPAVKLLAQESADADLKLAAAERAAGAGLLDVDRLRAFYDAQVFSPDQLQDPDKWAAKILPARVNALYFRALKDRAPPGARAVAFAAALRKAEAQNRFAVFAELAADTAAQIKPAAETAWLAPYVERVLHYTGNDKLAGQWLMVLASPTDGPVVNAIQLHAGLVQPSLENLARMQGAMTWLGQNALQPGGAKDWLVERATREIPLLDALGYVVPPDAQWAVSANTAGVAPAGAAAEALVGMSRSAQAGRLGETLLDALIALGEAGPTRVQGQTVVRVVKSLMAVGLRDEARAIAVEAILGAPVRSRR